MTDNLRLPKATRDELIEKGSGCDLTSILNECMVWGDEVFPEATLQSCVKHLKKEVVELEEDPANRSEIADCMMLLGHVAYLAKVNLVSALSDKLEINKARSWGEPGADGVRHHVKPAPDKDQPAEVTVKSL
jgi:hypothetical protein